MARLSPETLRDPVLIACGGRGLVSPCGAHTLSRIYDLFGIDVVKGLVDALFGPDLYHNVNARSHTRAFFDSVLRLMPAASCAALAVEAGLGAAERAWAHVSDRARLRRLSPCSWCRCPCVSCATFSSPS